MEMLTPWHTANSKYCDPPDGTEILSVPWNTYVLTLALLDYPLKQLWWISNKCIMK